MGLYAIKLIAEVSAVLRSESYVKCMVLTGNFSLTPSVFKYIHHATRGLSPILGCS